MLTFALEHPFVSILGGTAVACLLVLVWSCCVVASRADDAMARLDGEQR